MKKVRDPVPNVTRRNGTEKPTQDNAKDCNSVLASHILSAFHRSPFLFGILLGNLLRFLFEGLLILIQSVFP